MKIICWNWTNHYKKSTGVTYSRVTRRVLLFARTLVSSLHVGKLLIQNNCDMLRKSQDCIHLHWPCSGFFLFDSLTQWTRIHFCSWVCCMYSCCYIIASLLHSDKNLTLPWSSDFSSTLQNTSGIKSKYKMVRQEMCALKCMSNGFMHSGKIYVQY